MSAEEVAQVTEEDAAAWSQLEQQKKDEQAAREAQEAMAEAARTAAFAAFDDATAAVDSAINDKIAADLQASLEGREKFAAQKQLQMGARRRRFVPAARPPKVSPARCGRPRAGGARAEPAAAGPARHCQGDHRPQECLSHGGGTSFAPCRVPLLLADAQRPCLQAGGVR